ncbi:MAG: SurA N-terminal domain-containing protein, partial [Bacteroidales bacterium]|nr:SurA N-terminal domain-containing protein [Bacteroidales bacterium]
MTKRIIAFLLFIVAVNTSLKSQDKIIDKVIAVVGKDMVLHSEIETQYIQYMYQKGTYYEDPEIRCRAFEELLIQKLLLTQAYADSITVSDKQITQQIERKLNYYIMQFNSKEKFEEFYGKSVEAFKKEFYDITRDQIMIEQIQHGLVNNVKITPSEVRKFFNAIPVDSLPTIPS